MKPIFALLLAAMLATACSWTKIHVPPATDLSNRYSRVELDLRGRVADPSLIPILEADLRANLIDAGFLVGPDAPEAIRLEVEVNHFDPGNVFWRYVLPWLGVGRGSLAYTARYVDRTGTVLAEMAAKEIFTGYEVHFESDYGAGTIFDGAGAVRKVLILEAAKHIVKLARAELHPRPRRGRPPK